LGCGGSHAVQLLNGDTVEVIDVGRVTGWGREHDDAVGRGRGLGEVAGEPPWSCTRGLSGDNFRTLCEREGGVRVGEAVKQRLGGPVAQGGLSFGGNHVVQLHDGYTVEDIAMGRVAG